MMSLRTDTCESKPGFNFINTAFQQNNETNRKTEYHVWSDKLINYSELDEFTKKSV